LGVSSIAWREKKRKRILPAYKRWQLLEKGRGKIREETAIPPSYHCYHKEEEKESASVFACPSDTEKRRTKNRWKKKKRERSAACPLFRKHEGSPRNPHQLAPAKAETRKKFLPKKGGGTQGNDTPCAATEGGRDEPLDVSERKGEK